MYRPEYSHLLCATFSVTPCFAPTTMPGFRLDPGAEPSTVAALLDALERDLGPSLLAERVLLVAAEVLSNAAEHGSGPVRMEWTVADGTIDLTVDGEGPSADQVRRATLPEPSATRGRGLFLIHALASSVEDRPRGLLLSFK